MTVLVGPGRVFANLVQLALAVNLPLAPMRRTHAFRKGGRHVGNSKYRTRKVTFRLLTLQEDPTFGSTSLLRTLMVGLHAVLDAHRQNVQDNPCTVLDALALIQQQTFLPIVVDLVLVVPSLTKLTLHDTTLSPDFSFKLRFK